MNTKFDAIIAAAQTVKTDHLAAMGVGVDRALAEKRLPESMAKFVAMLDSLTPEERPEYIDYCKR